MSTGPVTTDPSSLPAAKDSSGCFGAGLDVTLFDFGDAFGVPF